MDSTKTHLPESLDPLMAFFSEHLPEVEFPETSLSALSELKSELDASKSRLDDARKELDEATAEYQNTRHALLQMAERAHAYALVFSKDEPELTKTLKAISVSAKVRNTRSKKKSKKKVSADDSTASLPFEESRTELTAVAS